MLAHQGMVHVLTRLLVVVVKSFLVDYQRHHEAHLMMPSFFPASLKLHTE
jgi:hypothetical protein